MLEVTGDMWELAYNYKAVCVTTNGGVTKQGKAVMGRGTALQLKERYPSVEDRLGTSLSCWGNHVALIGIFDGVWWISFPVKHSWRDSQADIELIKRSAHELMQFDSLNENILLPRPRCGNGRLLWDHTVKPTLEPILDDRIHVVHLP